MSLYCVGLLEFLRLCSGQASTYGKEYACGFPRRPLPDLNVRGHACLKTFISLVCVTLFNAFVFDSNKKRAASQLEFLLSNSFIKLNNLNTLPLKSKHCQIFFFFCLDILTAYHFTHIISQRLQKMWSFYSLTSCPKGGNYENKGSDRL